MRTGRPRNTQDPLLMEWLTIPKALVVLRSLGRPVSRTRLRGEIVTGRLPALVDRIRHDRFGVPIYVISREALDRWARTTFTPLRPAILRAG